MDSRRLPLCFAAALGLAAALALPAHAAACPRKDALGTSRTIVVDPTEHPRIGTMQYPETLPLADHEVVLTFDDGPLPKYSNQVLAILASQCVKPLLWDDRLLLKSLLTPSVDKKVAEYAWLEVNGLPLVHTFSLGVPKGLLDLHPRGVSGSAVRSWQDRSGRGVAWPWRRGLNGRWWPSGIS